MQLFYNIAQARGFVAARRNESELGRWPRVCGSWGHLAGGARVVYVSRGIVTGILILIWIVLWWQGVGD